MDAPSLTAAVKDEARRVGFDLVGVCPAVEPPRMELFHRWLDAGYAGEMKYLPDRSHAYEHPRHVLDGARSVVMLGMNYRTAEPAQAKPGEGRVSRYAWGAADYHDVVHERLGRLREFVHKLAPEAKTRGVVDTAPLLERDFAQLAGLGWIGKNTLLLNRHDGSWFFLAALLTDLALEYDEPFDTDHCGTCTACLDACPTNAFPQPYVLDATKCISYLTIELRGPIPLELRERIGDWVFGCDVCQVVCPWNHRAPQSGLTEFAPADDMNPIDAVSLFDLDDAAFRRRFRHTPLWRSKRRGLLRNAAIVLGNSSVEKGLAALVRGLNDHESVVRGASAWALGRYDAQQATAALEQRLAAEQDADVRDEIVLALAAQRQRNLTA